MAAWPKSQRRFRGHAEGPRNRVRGGAELRPGCRRREGFLGEDDPPLLAARAGQRSGQPLPSIPPQGRPPSGPHGRRAPREPRAAGVAASPRCRLVPDRSPPLSDPHRATGERRSSSRGRRLSVRRRGVPTSPRHGRMGSGDVNTSVASYLLDEAAVQRGLRAGVLVEDLRLRDALRSLLAVSSDARRFELPGDDRGRVRLFEGGKHVSFERDLASDYDASLLRIRRRVDDLARRMSMLTPGVP